MSTVRGLKVIKNSVNKNTEYKSVRTSADRVLISLLAAAPCFAAIVAGVFFNFFLRIVIHVIMLLFHLLNTHSVQQTCTNIQ